MLLFCSKFVFTIFYQKIKTKDIHLPENTKSQKAKINKQAKAIFKQFQIKLILSQHGSYIETENQDHFTTFQGIVFPQKIDLQNVSSKKKKKERIQ